MSVQGGKDYLYLVWKSEKSRKQYVVGQLSRNGRFEFSYSDEVQQAIDDGFAPLTCFQDRGKVYTNDKLFPIFSSRLPDKKRKNIDDILKKYGLKEFDEYNLLKRSGARLPIDNLEFIDPIFDTGEKISRIFYMAGVRHYLDCCGEDCAKAAEVTRGDEVFLKMEPENKYDKYALQVLSETQKLLGYIPRYYSQGVTESIHQGKKVLCHIYNVEKDNNCNECIKLIMNIE